MFELVALVDREIVSELLDLEDKMQTTLTLVQYQRPKVGRRKIFPGSIPPSSHLAESSSTLFRAFIALS